MKCINKCFFTYIFNKNAIKMVACITLNYKLFVKLEQHLYFIIVKTLKVISFCTEDVT